MLHHLWTSFVCCCWTYNLEQFRLTLYLNICDPELSMDNFRRQLKTFTCIHNGTCTGYVYSLSLPSHPKDADLSYSEFRRSLKTFLFGQWGHDGVWTVLTAPSRNIRTYLLNLHGYPYVLVLASIRMQSKAVFPLRLRVALPGVAWREIETPIVFLFLSPRNATQRHAQP